MLIANELVKFQVRGPGLMNLFKLFSEVPSTEHTFEYIVRIQPQLEKGQLGDYYITNFELVRKLTEQELESVAVEMKRFHENRIALKQSYEAVAKENKPQDELPVIDVDEGGDEDRGHDQLVNEVG